MARIQDKKLKQIVTIIKEAYKPKRLFLFGSRANGKATASSDYDFVAVVPTRRGGRMINWERAGDLIKEKCGVDADVFIYTQKEFDEWKNEFSSIPETALNTGKEIEL